MNASKKIIRGVVNSRGFTITSPITQWDYGWQFIPEIEDLPATYRLDFSNDEHHGTALPVYCSTDGAEVPTELIDTGKDIWVWFVHIGDGYGITEYKWKIPNKCKPKTEQDEPTPTQQSSIDQAISVVNDAVETVEQKASEADQSARSASDDADRAERAKTSAETAQGKAEEAQESAERAKDDAETSERNASESERKAKGYAETASEKADSITGLTATATTLEAGSSATASYSNGTLTLGIPRGSDGDDGYSPTASVTKSGNTATISITDKNGTTSAQVEDGTDGTDGVSPTVTITPITGGHRITITDADGEHSADVMDGTGGVDDVQINGSSIVNDGVANVPTASASRLGVIKTSNANGIYVNSNGDLSISEASSANVKTGTNVYKPITPHIQHEAAFYGLSKASGDTTQSESSNAVGNYTDEAKVAIQKMLGIYESPYEMLNDFTLEEESGFDLTADMNGNPYDLRNVFIYVYYPANLTTVTAGYGRYRCFGDGGRYTNAETGRYSTNSATMYKYVTVERKANLAYANFSDRQTTGGAGTWRIKSFITNGVASGVCLDLGNITRISCIDLEPAGTQIKIYGQRAY